MDGCHGIQSPLELPRLSSFAMTFNLPSTGVGGAGSSRAGPSSLAPSGLLGTSLFLSQMFQKEPLCAIQLWACSGHTPTGSLPRGCGYHGPWVHSLEVPL